VSPETAIVGRELLLFGPGSTGAHEDVGRAGVAHPAGVVLVGADHRGVAGDGDGLAEIVVAGDLAGPELGLL